MTTSLPHNYKKKINLKGFKWDLHINWFYFITIYVPEIVCIICVTVLILIFYNEGLSSDFLKDKWPQKTLRTTNLAYQKHSIFHRNKVGFIQVFFPHIHRGDPYYKISLSKHSFILVKKCQYPQAHKTIPRSPKTVYSLSAKNKQQKKKAHSITNWPPCKMLKYTCILPY